MILCTIVWSVVIGMLQRSSLIDALNRGSSSGGTALREAIDRKHFDIVEELLKLMTKEDLEIEDGNGSTAFFYALIRGMAPIVASMVKKNEKLVTMRFSNVSGGIPPVLFARFLYSRTPIQILTEDNNGRDGAELFSQCIFYINKFGNAGSITVSILYSLLSSLISLLSSLFSS